MEKISTKIKKWRNSFGVILPKNIVDSENLKEGLEVNIIVQPNNFMIVGDLMKFSKENTSAKTFGILSNWKKPTDQIMREIDEELWFEE